MINLNLNKQEKTQKIQEIRGYLRDYRCEKRALEFKYTHGMPMTRKEELRLEEIDALIDQMLYLIEWYQTEDDKDLWRFD